MQCRFLQHGLAVSYDQVIKPCCVWNYGTDYAKDHTIDKVDIVNWHKSHPVKQYRQQLQNKVWPTECLYCQTVESSGRQDSMRGNGEQAYAHYLPDDLTLEIRPGSVCNFACQTCWPEASSRVSDFYQRAGLISKGQSNGRAIDNFDFLVPVKHRIKNVVLMGGEPFYDPHCQRFLQWATLHLDCAITMFTNGSMIDWTWVDQYPGHMIFVFSLDAVGKPAEYVRFGTDWTTVWKNYNLARNHTKVQVRVNVTVSIYNYFYLQELLDLLSTSWPEVVSFGKPVSISKLGIDQTMFDERVVPIPYRSKLTATISDIIDRLESADIELGQKQNAVGVMHATIERLRSVPFDTDAFRKWHDFVSAMDRVKHVKIVDHCPELAEILQYQPN